MIHTRRGKGARNMIYAQAAWVILNKTEWLPIIAVYLALPETFFDDNEIAGHCSIGLAWIIRELQEFWHWVERGMKIIGRKLFGGLADDVDRDMDK